MSQLVATAVSTPAAVARKPMLGFVGVGWIGLHRLKAIAETANAELCGVVEPQEDMAKKALEIAPKAEVIATFEKMLDAEIDGVVIATPSALHAQQASAALKRGMAVFCQKPLGRNLSETQRVIDAARKSDRLLGVDLCYRYTTAARKVRELIRNGTLGEIFHIDFVFHNAYGPDKPWFYDAKLSGGGCLIDLGIHLVDLAMWFMEFPKIEYARGSLFANGKRLGGRYEQVEDFASATLRLAGNIDVRIACSWRAHAGQDAVIEADVYGTKGGARIRNVNGSFYDFVAEHNAGTTRKILCEPPDAWGGRAVLDWLNKLRCGNQYDPAIETLSRVAEALDRIYES